LVIAVLLFGKEVFRRRAPSAQLHRRRLLLTLQNWLTL
jgi:hypothetical protein